GTLAWLARWPEALAGPGAPMLAGLLLSAAGVALFLVALARPRRRAAAPGPRPGALLLAAPVLACAAAAVQAPVARLALANEAAFAITTNLRFYYLALAALAVTLGLAITMLRAGAGDAGAAATPSARAGGRRIVAALGWATAALAVAWWGPRSLQLAEAWRGDTANAARLATVRAAARAVAALEVRPGCVVVLRGAESNPDFAGFSDTLVKAQLPKQAAAIDCLVYGSTPPWVALTRRGALPGFEGWPQRTIAGGRKGPQAAGSLAFHFP